MAIGDIVRVPSGEPDEKDDAAGDAAGTPGGGDVNTVPACHRSWLSPTRLEKQTSMAPGGKIQQMVIPMNVGTMFPCFGAACMLWDAEHKMCLDRSTAFLRAGRVPVAPVLPVYPDAGKKA